MLLSAARVKGVYDARARWQVGHHVLLYHLLLAGLVAVLVMIGRQEAVLMAIAYAPAIVRALWRWATLSNKLPPLRRVGLGETFFALWFSVFFLIAS